MNLGIDLCGVALKNPVMTASGQIDGIADAFTVDYCFRIGK